MQPLDAYSALPKTIEEVWDSWLEFSEGPVKISSMGMPIKRLKVVTNRSLEELLVKLLEDPLDELFEELLEDPLEELLEDVLDEPLKEPLEVLEELLEKSFEPEISAEGSAE